MNAMLKKTEWAGDTARISDLPQTSQEPAGGTPLLRPSLPPSPADAVIDFDPALMESVVMRAITSNRPGPAGFDIKLFHAESDPLYRIRELDQRAIQFRGLFARWFQRGQFDVPFVDALVELPDVAAHVARTTVTGAASRAEERADLAAGATGKLVDVCVGAGMAHYWLGISIQPSRLLDRPLLRRWLRHELWHVRDMLDPSFEYHRQDFTPDFGPAERLPQRVVQDRYALLWALSIDTRIERAGLLPLHSKDERLARLADAFPGLTAPQYSTILQSIDQRGFRHPELLDLARWPRKLIEENSACASLDQPIRGSACPLCRFPTFGWADLNRPAARSVAAAVQQAYPSWSPDLGICHTCFDLFSIRSGTWA